MSIVKNGMFFGIFSDYFKIIEKESGLRFHFIEGKTFQGIKDKLKKGTIDILPMPLDNEMKKYAYESNIFTNFNFVLVMNKNNRFVEKIENLNNKIFALPNDYISNKIIRKYYPNIKIINYKNNKDALEAISSRKADVTLIHEAIAVENIKKYFPDLKVVGISKHQYNHRFIINKNKEELLSIINKVIRNISKKEHNLIKNKWVNYKISTAVDYKIIYQIVLIFIIILLIILFFLKRISNNKNKIMIINNKLEDTILKLKKTKSDLTEQKNLFEALFKGTSDGLALIEDGKIINSNYSLLKMFNIKDIKFFKTYILGDLSPEFQANGQKSSDIYIKYYKLCEKNNYSTFECEVVKLSGETFWINVVLVKIQTNNRNLIYSITRDISSRKLLENDIENKAKDLEFTNSELEDSNEELQKTIQNLKQTQDRLIDAEKMASLGGLVAGVAHEINTPVGIGLTGITHLEDFTNDINNKYNSEKMSQNDFEEYLKTSKDLTYLIHKNLLKAASLVQSFKQVAVDQSSEEKRVFNLCFYINEVLQSIHSFTKKSNVEIIVFCDDDYEINSYPGAYSQIITNLVMNSLIHGYKKDQKGLISLNITYLNNKVKIIYKDDGVGIKTENLKKIFDPFFTTNRKNGGSGLGLNIIYNIITSKLNGSIECKSEKNNGTEFTIVLSTKD